MLTSIDGKVTGKYLTRPECKPYIDKYIEMDKKFDTQGFIYGKNTMKESYSKFFLDKLPSIEADTIDQNFNLSDDFTPHNDGKYYSIVYDRKGTLICKNNHLPKQENKKIIIVLTEQASKDYLLYLRSIKCNYIMAGKDVMDIKVSLEKIKKYFPKINILLLEGGSSINASFLKYDCIDEITVIQTPFTGETKDMPLFNDPEKSCHYTIKKIQKFEPNGLIINYIPDKKPIRPYIICHILTSIDGKATGKFLGDKKIEHLNDEYFRIHTEFNANGFACGKNTFLEGFVSDNNLELDLSKFKDEKINKNEDFVYEKISEYKFFGVCFDRKGSINWKKNILVDDLPQYNNSHIIQVLTENVKDGYLAYLRSIGLSYIICGKDDIDLNVCLEKLRLKFGIKVLLLEGGSLINGSFMKAGVIDEISLVQVPMSAEKDDKPLFYESNIQNYSLEAFRELKNGVYMLYKHQ
jgi:riboflavin biosynthesis pyrimidine reductase